MALLAVIGIGVLSVLCCLGTAAAIALPNFNHYNVKSKQSEVKSNLKYVFVAERAYFAEKDDYSEEIEKIGFLPERGNRYLYLLKPGGGVLIPGAAGAGPHGIIAVDPMKDPAAITTAYVGAVPPGLLAEAGLHGTCPADCYVTVIAVGNLDKDPDLDVWSISTQSRTIGGTSVPAGQPFNHVDDLN